MTQGTLNLFSIHDILNNADNEFNARANKVSIMISVSCFVLFVVRCFSKLAVSQPKGHVYKMLSKM